MTRELDEQPEMIAIISPTTPAPPDLPTSITTPALAPALLPPINVPSHSQFTGYGQDYPSRFQLGIQSGSGFAAGSSSRPRGHTVADSPGHPPYDIANVFENIPRGVYNPPDDFLRNPRPVHSHVRTGSSSSLPAEHGRSFGIEWFSSSRHGIETPPPGRGSESPAYRSHPQFPSTPGASGPPSRRSTDESNYASPPIATSDYSGSYFSQHSMRNPTSPTSGFTAAMTITGRDSGSGGRRESVTATHPYLITSRRPSLGEAVGVGSGYARARSPLGSLAQRVPDTMQIDPAGGGSETRKQEGLEGLPKRDVANDQAIRAMVKQQRIESEQRRRDDMREGFRRLYEILPPNSQKTKTVTLDRAINHIAAMEAANRELHDTVARLRAENQQLRDTNYTLVRTQAKRLGVDELEDNIGFQFEQDYGHRG
ncbi:hypothetical protein HD553DRAFT_340207 [Filobasidium floriforme]|uniref:uncharacterized protein n=1 Tax=Filobasidium floriforme TaxID=5210 RepID=UPI001E8D0FE5|nr:uncharacterized protein HD553DRAFT_340207 [Filobasidium floriforme]KAH8088090.1 hypothetical protein HD553DRAFT_340207 [Filobasidium floriforme]